MGSDTFRTTIEMLQFRANENGNMVAFTFADKPYTYAQMWDKINAFGSYLQSLDLVPTDRILMAIPNSPEFFWAFYGIQRMGGIAVPLFPNSSPERVFSIAETCRAKVVVAPEHLTETQIAEFKKAGLSRGIQVIKVSESTNPIRVNRFPEIQPDDIAFIQYTSGSTGTPKGVMISQDNLLVNIAQMTSGMRITSNDIFVSWLPVYHDMGLILMTMAPFYSGTIVHLLPTDLQNIDRWLKTIQNHKATFTAAPDFAYRLCLRHASKKDFDLTSLRMALNASETVRAKTIQDFETTFGLKNVMVSGYGLAEATVGVSTWPPGSSPKVDSRGYVSVGPPFPGVEIKILQEDNHPFPTEVGEIAVRSLANTRGYFHDPTATRHLFTDDGFILTGDLGYIDAEGNLYFISRKKNIIKRSGETISPSEIEGIVDQLDFVRYSAAVGVEQIRTEGEQVYVFAEIRDWGDIQETGLYERILEIVNTIHRRMGFRPGRVYLLKDHTIPMTANGKIQHGVLKTKYLEGSLRASDAILYPEY